jgi:L-ascorbate metabolism protein UlaG (beta-lactamase superfamily)
MSLIAELYKPELAFLPIGDFYTMGPDQAALAVRMLKVKTIIPMHYGTFPALKGTPEDLSAELKGQEVRVFALEKGQPVQWPEAVSSISAR